MDEVFATKIIINEVLNIKDFEIPLSETERRHLIITGKNGSGKTTVLNALKANLNTYTDRGIGGDYETIKNIEDSLTDKIDNLDEDEVVNLEYAQDWLKDFGKVTIYFNKKNIDRKSLSSRKASGGKIINVLSFSSYPVLDAFLKGEFIIAFFEAKRNSEIIAPTGIKKFDIKPFYKIEDTAGQYLIQHMVNLKADKLFAKEEAETEEPQKIDDWFAEFEERILDIFETADSQLQFDRKNYNFNIIEPGKEPYNLNQLSDGYSSILNIVSELIMRMEEHKTKSYDVQGIVLIDEIETHLHIELQKKVLPFLTSFFPKIQFIVTTHSPFVINSIENAVICDLEKRIVLDNLSGYSYDAIVEGYFDADKYSTVLKQQVEEFEMLMSKDSLDETGEARLKELKKYLDGIPKFLSDELAVKLQQIKLKNLNKKKQK